MNSLLAWLPGNTRPCAKATAARPGTIAAACCLLLPNRTARECARWAAQHSRKFRFVMVDLEQGPQVCKTPESAWRAHDAGCNTRSSGAVGILRAGVPCKVWRLYPRERFRIAAPGRTANWRGALAAGRRSE